MVSRLQPVPGSPAWSSTRAVALTQRQGRPRTDMARIVEAALRLIDDTGIHAMTLRSLAEDLGSGTATLYRRFERKEE